jgi:hypothetical protein
MGVLMGVRSAGPADGPKIPSFISLWIYTMNRWIFGVALLAIAGFSHAQAPSQVGRQAPADVRPGILVVTAPPDITLDGKPDRLSPGARIRDTRNLLLLSGSVVGQQLPVVYRREAAGLVHEVWVLTEQEYAKVARAAEGGGSDNARRLNELLNTIFGTRP